MFHRTEIVLIDVDYNPKGENELILTLLDGISRDDPDWCATYFKRRIEAVLQDIQSVDQSGKRLRITCLKRSSKKIREALLERHAAFLTVSEVTGE